MRSSVKKVLSLWLVIALAMAPLAVFSSPGANAGHCAMGENHADKSSGPDPAALQAESHCDMPGCQACKTDVCQDDTCLDHSCSPGHNPFAGLVPFSTALSGTESAGYLKTDSGLISRIVPPPLPPPA